MSLRTVPVSIVAAAAVLLSLWGCGDSPTQTRVFDAGTVSVSVAPSEVQTLSETTFHASMMDDAGGMLMGLQMMEMEYRLEGTDTWMPVEMFPDADGYYGTCIFTSSGDYDLRAMGMMHGSHHMDEMARMGDPLHVWRAHRDAGGYRVEFESFPGRVQEGTTPILRFWVFEPGQGGTAAPVAGLAPTVQVTEPPAAPVAANATETQPGVYEIEHAFSHAGMAEVGLRFRGSGGSDAEAVFMMPVFAP